MTKPSLNAKFIAILTLFVLTSFGIALLGLNRMDELNSVITLLSGKVMPRTIALKLVEAKLNLTKNLEKKLIPEQSETEMQPIVQDLDASVADLSKQLTVWSDLGSPEGKANVSRIREILVEWKAVHEEVRRLALANNTQDAFAVSQKSAKILAGVEAIVKEASERNLEFVK